MVERLLRISPDGSEILSLYSDELPRFGRMECKRASDVLFDSESQKWYVEYVDPEGHVMRFGHSDTREMAIRFEIIFMEALLSSRPEEVESILGNR